MDSDMLLEEEIKRAWSAEYQRKGIPSSFRKDPTAALVDFISWVKSKRGVAGGMAADIGSGLGRNSFYLTSQGYRVTGIELLEENAEVVNREADLASLPIKVVAQDAALPWPMAAHSLDIAVDLFCYKHIVDKAKQANYRKELWNALKAEGLYFISLASENDGFYGPLLEYSTNRSQKLIMDPYANIPSFLYSREELIAEFSDLFELVEIDEQASTSPMYGKEYSRKVLNAIFRMRG